MAREVLAETRDDPTSLRFAAQVLAYSAKDYETALSTIERSLYLNPNSAQGYTGSGWVNAHSSRPLVAIEHFHRAMRLSPVDPEKGIALSGIGMSYLMLEQFDEALSWGESALREMPNYGSSHRVVIGALVGLGRLDEARAAAGRLMEAFPTYTLALQREINPWRDEKFAERYLEALRIAGIRSDLPVDPAKPVP
jgi:adenylate cyclase